ncbi:MAG: TerB N-terminal domain-containing protein [Hydrogenophaga sp.]|uniref:tellurite resistance TerB family protein n=1 Tax=Hydrogenophaga sp. TaxID=1904254 RepID=UPI002733C1DA|nr:TerB N-terminal domain-containing protein [Hydrogenophaga sp.]MDP3626990.1 TerB N-terminal domain-containing protein [Hydrogenophaga sp.]
MVLRGVANRFADLVSLINNGQKGQGAMDMARKGKGGSAGVLVAAVIGGLALLASVPAEAWVFIGVAVVGYFAYRYYKASSNSNQAAPVPVPRTKPSPQARALAKQAPRSADQDEPVSLRSATSSDSPEQGDFRVPTAPKGFGNATWVGPGQPINVAGFSIPGGMIYVGTQLKTPSGENDPCLINSSLSASKSGDYTERQMGYWPSYSTIQSSARGAYLKWLAGGRKDPAADIGYVFLFFYGLERRAILDASSDAAAQNDWPAIAAELRRLLGIYGEISGSFRRYAGELLNWVSLAEHPAKLYDKVVPSFPRAYELPLYIRLALGQTAVDGVPVPAGLALAWAKNEPGVSLRTPAVRCADQFDTLFVQKYEQLFGTGMPLPRNRTKLKLVYRPASAGFNGFKEPTLTFGDVPDVSVLTGPLKKLQDLVETVTKELEPYSRFLGKSATGKDSLEGLLQLPATLWPEQAQKAFQQLKSRMGDGMVSMTFQELLTSLGAQATLTKDRTVALARALESMNMGIEPDILSGAKTPKADERIVLFAVPPGEVLSRATPSYQVAVLTLQLASAVASADGEFNVKEMGHLRQQAQAWTHLTPNHLRRLMAHLRLLMVAPVSLTSLKKKLEPLEASAKETIAAFMATVAQSDGTVSPDEVKMLEKVYKVLGVEPKKVFSDVHAASAGVKATGAPKTEAVGFKLDPARIAALQQDTARVSAMLANIFKEEEVAIVAVPESEADTQGDAEEATNDLLGLDEAHTSLARMLLSRPSWSRAELLDVAADLDLMLDGALERINEASFDAHDMPFTEGEDPVEVNADVLEKLEA